MHAPQRKKQIFVFKTTKLPKIEAQKDFISVPAGTYEVHENIEFKGTTDNRQNKKSKQFSMLAMEEKNRDWIVKARKDYVSGLTRQTSNPRAKKENIDEFMAASGF